jgi:hypothetical protein
VEPPLSPALLAAGPLVVGATGGSGTRVVARILEQAGLFVGAELNESHDAWRFGDYSDRWINTYLAAGDTLDAETERAMAGELRELIASHTLPIASAPRAWGWKEPRSIYLLPFLHGQLPALRFLHVVRDGRDMALSDNQNQPRKHGDAAPISTGLTGPERAIALWSWVNLRALEYGRRELAERYLRIRFEDLCRDPVGTAGEVLEFAGLDGDPTLARDLVSPPGSLGRWRQHDTEAVTGLERAGRDGLAAFEYEPAGRG